MNMKVTKKLLLIEFRRVFKSKLFYISLTIGIILVTGAFINEAVPHMDILYAFDGSAASYPFSVFNSWIGNWMGYEPFATSYLYVCILLASLPYCHTFSKDNKNQYILQYYCRIDKNKVHLAKFITTYVTGGMIVFIPVFLNLIMTMMFIPALKPIENGMFIGAGMTILSRLYYDNAFVYVAIYMVQFFIYGGAFSVIALAFSYFFDNSFLVMLSPFVAFFGLGVISTLCRRLFGLITFNPNVLMAPSHLLYDIELIPILVILITCIGMIIRINVLFPNAKVITYTSDNPADLDGLIIKPVNYKVYTMEEYSEISSRYKNIQGEKADKSRVVVLNILLKNTTEDIITYYPSGNMVIEKLHARNGVTLQEPDKMTVTVMPGEELEVGLHAYIGPSQLDYKLFDKIDSSTVTFVYAYYPYRQRIVFNK